MARETAGRGRRARCASARAGVVPAFERPDGHRDAQTGGLPVVSASLVVRSGSDANPLDKPGLAGFTAALLDQGTATRSALQLADEVAQIGASLNTGTSRDASTLTTSSLSRNFPAALALLADVALRPSFPAEEVERVRARRLADLVEQRGESGSDCRTNVTGEGSVRHAPVRIQRDRNRRVEQAADARRSAGVLAAAFRAGERRARRHGRDYGSRAPQAGRGVVWQLAAKARPCRRSWARLRPCAPRLVIVDRPGSPQTQLRVATIRRAAQQSRLRACARDEHDSRRHVLQPHQHESARGARLHLRRELAVRRSGAAAVRSRSTPACVRMSPRRLCTK